MSTPDEIETAPGVVPGLQIVEPETGPEGIESRVMLQRARARLLGRGEETPAGVGRYVIVERVGAGAMGVVLRAYDPKLRREVALKIVRPRSALEGDEAQARLLREAQALARLSHPNVVGVYDAESTPDGVCIAMEYVEGETLRYWLRQQPRAVDEVLAMIIAAARGLAAAHAAGLVHRDMKPDNCLVGADGRLRVTDFGLARAAEGGQSSMGQSMPGPIDDDEPLTQMGTVLGTPAYMAPEQHEGTTADAATDQYALGVMMWEALYGERPFRGPRIEALAAAKHEGPPQRPPKRVPSWLHAIVVRALAVSPEQRWPSVAELADALESGQAHVRKRKALMVVAGLGAATLAIAGWHQIDRHRGRMACEVEAAGIHRDVWNEEARGRVREGLVGTGARHALDTHGRLVAWIDPYVERWRETWAQTCVAAEVEGRLSPELHRRAEQCLAERRDALAAVLAVLAEGEGAAVRTAVMTVAELPDVQACADVSTLERRRRIDGSAGLRGDLHRARALAMVERYEEAFELVGRVLDAVVESGAEDVALEASSLHGIMAGRLGRHDDAEASLRHVLVEAGALGLDEIAAEAAVELVATVGLGLQRHGAALAHADTATLLVERIDPPRQVELRVRLLEHRARILLELDAPEDAEQLLQEALDIVERMRGRDHPSVATRLAALGSVVRARGSLEEAEPLYARAIGVTRDALGPEHPLVEELRSVEEHSRGDGMGKPSRMHGQR